MTFCGGEDLACSKNGAVFSTEKKKQGHEHTIFMLQEFDSFLLENHLKKIRS